MKWYVCTISFYSIMDKKLLGSTILLAASLIWGSSFIVMKNATDFLPSATLLFIRFFLASLFLTIMFFKQLKMYPVNKIKGGLLTGLALFVAYYFQTWGISYTTPGKNAFLTAIYCALVPFFTWMFDKKRPDTSHFVSAFLCVLGIGCISLNGDLSMNIGDVLTIIGGVFFALHIIMIQKYSYDLDRCAFTAMQFYGATIAAFVVSALFEDMSVIKQIQPSIYLQIFYLSFFASALTMVCQTVGLKYVDECKASLLLSLESVFGVIFSVIFYKEVLNMQIMIGFIIVFCAIVISQTQLSFFKKKTITKFFIIIGMLFTSLPLRDVNATSGLNVNAPYSYIYDLTTQQELYSKNAHEKIYPASMTKVMTALVALDYIEDLSATVKIAKYDFEGLWEAGASQAGFKVGEEVTYRDLIYGIILPSGADACRAVSRLLFETEENMAEAMNQKAKELGLTNTHFVNTSGLHDDNHYTTVYEMAIITKEALKDPFFKEVFSTRSYRTEISNRYMAATLLKLRWSKGISIDHIIGCKTGYTDASRSCLTSLVESDGHEIIAVFAKEAGSGAYVTDAKTVKNYFTQQYQPITLYNKGDVIQTIQIVDGVKETYEITATEDIVVYGKNSATKEDYLCVYEGATSLKAPTQLNDKLGTLKISYDDKEIKTYEYMMNEEIDATTFAKVMRFIMANIIYIIAGIVLVVGALIVCIKTSKRKKVQR